MEEDLSGHFPNLSSIVHTCQHTFIPALTSIDPITTMTSIEIDQEVFSELARRVTGFGVTPNDVLRHVLGLDQTGKPVPVAIKGEPEQTAPHADSPEAIRTLAGFITRPTFQRAQAINRFLFLLWWCYSQDTAGFTKMVDDYQRGNRRYFGRTQQEVENSGVGIKAKAIPRTPFWVLSTLDNRAKRTIIEDVFRHLGLSSGDVNLAKEQLADSGIRRGPGLALQYL